MLPSHVVCSVASSSTHLYHIVPVGSIYLTLRNLYINIIAGIVIITTKSNICCCGRGIIIAIYVWARSSESQNSRLYRVYTVWTLYLLLYHASTAGFSLNLSGNQFSIFPWDVQYAAESAKSFLKRKSLEVSARHSKLVQAKIHHDIAPIYVCSCSIWMCSRGSFRVLGVRILPQSTTLRRQLPAKARRETTVSRRRITAASIRISSVPVCPLFVTQKYQPCVHRKKKSTNTSIRQNRRGLTIGRRRFFVM